MVDKLSDKCVRKLVENGVINSEDKELYLYGLHIAITQTIFVFYVVFIGVIFKRLIESIVLYFAFQTIRKYAGGYHASSPIVCNIFSGISLLICVITINGLLVIDKHTILILVTIIFSISIIILSPLDTPEKRLTDKEIIRYKKFSIGTTIVIVGFILVFYIFNLKNIYIPLCMSVVLESLLLISGKIKSLKNKAH